MSYAPTLSTHTTPHRKAHDRLSDVNILVQDADVEMANLVKSILKNLGFGAVYHARDGEAGINILRQKNIDLIITDWDMKPVDGIDFINYIRTSSESPNKTIPIIMLTGKTQKDQVEVARDAGMTEFVVKPFSVQTLCNRIILVVEHPRNFILAPNYNGPDRRRRTQASTTPQERRTPIEQATVIAQSEHTKSVRVNEQDITLVNADYSLKEKIGEDISIKEILSPEKIQEAQQIIANAKDEFMQWIVSDLRDLEESYITLNNNPAHKPTDVKTLSGCILSIKSRAGTFGFDLASIVSDMMLRLIKDHQSISPSLLRAVRKHIDVLYVIFQRNIQGSGGELGKDLMDTLTALAKKLSDA
jgi:two-component system chemotaxis response regulator CheY